MYWWTLIHLPTQPPADNAFLATTRALPLIQPKYGPNPCVPGCLRKIASAPIKGRAIQIVGSSPSRQDLPRRLVWDWRIIFLSSSLMLTCISLAIVLCQSFLPFATSGSAEPLRAERILELRSVYIPPCRRAQVFRRCVPHTCVPITCTKHMHRETVRGMFYHAYTNYMEVRLYMNVE